MKKDIKSITIKKYINFLNAYQYVQSIARIISHQDVTVRKSQHIDTGSYVKSCQIVII